MPRRCGPMDTLENTASCVLWSGHLIDTKKMVHNRPVSYSNGWTGSSMKWRLMRSN